MQVNDNLTAFTDTTRATPSLYLFRTQRCFPELLL